MGEREGGRSSDGGPGRQVRSATCLVLSGGQRSRDVQACGGVLHRGRHRPTSRAPRPKCPSGVPSRGALRSMCLALVRPPRCCRGRQLPWRECPGNGRPGPPRQPRPAAASRSRPGTCATLTRSAWSPGWSTASPAWTSTRWPRLADRAPDRRSPTQTRTSASRFRTLRSSPRPATACAELTTNPSRWQHPHNQPRRLARTRLQRWAAIVMTLGKHADRPRAAEAGSPGIGSRAAAEARIRPTPRQ